MSRLQSRSCFPLQDHYAPLRDFDRAGFDGGLQPFWYGEVNVREAFLFVDFDLGHRAEGGECLLE